MQHLLTAFSRNNLFLSAGGTRPLWEAVDCSEPKYCLPNHYTPTWATDVDHDGFDWGAAPRAFRWANRQFFPDLASFAASAGIERRGIRIRKEELFPRWPLPEQRARVEPPLLALKEGSPAVDGGVPLPNLNDGFRGKAPDLGAHELGAAPVRYGPREK